MADVALRVNGKEYAGWKAARVTRGIETVAGSFDLEVSDRWGSQEAPWPIGEEDECTVLINGTKVITGYVDKRSVSYDAVSHSLGVSGRDKTGDLVDCSAYLDGKWEFKNVPVLTLAKRVADPYGISVALQAGLVLPKAPAKISIDPGDSAFEVIERACRAAGLLPVSDGAGGLLLTRTGTTRAVTELVEGENILAADGEFDASQRYRGYFVFGQHQGTDELNGASAAAVKGEAADANVRRAARTLIIRAEGNATPEHAKKRAQWEATVRAARGDAVTVTVQGWQQGDGSLWPINALVRVRSPWIGVAGDMLITQAIYSLDSGGTKTQLTLRRPDAFTPEPTVTTASTGQWKQLAGGV